MTGKGTYVILSKATKSFQCEVGKLGKFAGAKGYYLYIGSAQGSGGIRARVGHHLRIASNPHWHFDFVRPYLSPFQVWYIQADTRYEHRWATALEKLPGSVCVVARFGASDCRCHSHLYYFKQAPELNVFRKSLARMRLNTKDLQCITVSEWES